MSEEQLRKENEKLKEELKELKGKLLLVDALPGSVVGGRSFLDEEDQEDDKNSSLSIIVLGASGDLAKKKTFPALWALYSHDLLPPKTHLIGVARHKMSSEEFRKTISKTIKASDENKDKLKTFIESVEYFTVSGYDSVDSFKKLESEVLSKVEKGKGNRLFYLALPPSVFVEASKTIKTACQAKTGWNRVIVEKPFGRDLESSNELAKNLSVLFKESQLFRIDHYLGKEMVQNLMILRFANMVFEPLWNRNYIHNVRIVFKEDFGTQGRGGYFDSYGIIRDVMQNHLMQILSILAMEPPVSLSAEDVRNEKVKVLCCMPEIKVEDVVIGQYLADKNGKEKGYTEDEGVPNDSVTPTFAQAILHINNPRWDGVPFILKTAKAVEEKKAEIRIQFRDFPGKLFPESQRNELVIRVQPDEAVYLKMNNKTPGLSSKLVLSDLDLSYRTKFSERYNPDAYERLILEAIRGDHNLFVRVDELSEAWRIYTPLLHKLEKEKVKPISYEYGSRGPAEADKMAKGVGWRHVEYDWQAKM